MANDQGTCNIYRQAISHPTISTGIGGGILSGISNAKPELMIDNKCIARVFETFDVEEVFAAMKPETKQKMVKFLIENKDIIDILIDKLQKSIFEQV